MDIQRNDPAPTTPTQPTQDSALDKIRSEIAELKKKVEKPRKDFWEKLTALSGLITGVSVALIGFYATHVYNRREMILEGRRKDQELLIAQIQTVEKFFPYLSSTQESTKGAALVSIAALGDEDLAVRLAKLFSGPGATSALTTIASTAKAPAAAKAEEAILDVLAYLKDRVVTVNEGNQRRAMGFVASSNGRVVTTATAIKSIPPDAIRIGLSNGKLVPASLIKTDLEKDFALLSIPRDEALTPLALSQTTPEIGERVTALFFDVNESMQLLIGSITQSHFDIKGLGPSKIGVNLQLKPGSSGAPVVDKEGRFLGLVQASMGEIGILASAEDVLAFVNSVNEAEEIPKEKIRH